MNASIDTLRNALRPFPCKWDECPVILASWALLEKHSRKVHGAGTTKSNGQKVYQCKIRQPKARLCSQSIDNADHLVDHIMLVHYNQNLYICPVQDCRINLRRYKADEGIQEHFDLHLSAGEALPQAVLRRIPRTPPSLLPPIPAGSLKPYQLLDSLLLPSFKHKSKKYPKWQGALDHTWVGSSLPCAWLDVEEDDSPAEAKPRRIRSLMGATTHPTTQRPALGAPPRFRGVALSGLPETSVGFDSIGFHQTAREAFEIVAAQSSDEEPEPTPKPTKLRLKLKPEPSL